MRDDRARGRRRLVGPDRVDEVVDPCERHLPRLERRAQRLDLLRRMQPGIESDPPAARQCRGEEVGRRILGDAQDLESIEVDLPLTCSR